MPPTIKDYLKSPALLAMIELAQQSKVLLRWADGGEVLVLLDTFLPSDETHDGSEEAVVDVLEIIKSAASVNEYDTTRGIVISSAFPPSSVISPDRLITWPHKEEPGE